KGKGFDFSENDATTFHSPKPFNVEGCRVELASGGRSFTAAFSDALEGVMERDSRAVACTAAMPDGTGLTKILERFSRRSWDTGICESHAMDMMAGLAKTGHKPFFAVYSTFLQRAFDQAFQEVALQGLPVRLCLDRAGLVGGDGAVHHGFCDISMLRVFPGVALTAAMDEPSLLAAMEFMCGYDAGLSCVRYPRDNVSDRFADTGCPPFELGKARPLLETPDAEVAIFAYGTMAISAMEAADVLQGDVAVSVYDARFARPVDIDLLERLLAQGTRVVTVEDHGLEGGFGSCVVDACQARGLDTRLITALGIPCRWIYQGSRSGQLEEAGLDVPSIVTTVRTLAATQRPGVSSDEIARSPKATV
ncbi:MAG: transketolase C-terminal domain-containing protein, partial [Planctomycetota bacterium]